VAALKFTPQAKNDLLSLYTYIAANNPTAARTFREDIQNKCRVLAEFPEMGQPRDEILTGLRSLSAKSYVVYYRPIQDGVLIARIYHTARRLPPEIIG